MTGPNERELENLASGEEWDLPARGELIQQLAHLRDVLQKVASEPGVSGRTGINAAEAFAEASDDAEKIIQYLRDDLRESFVVSNATRAEARRLLAQLPADRLNPGQEAAVRGAAVGTTLVLGPLSILAGQGAVHLLNDHLSEQREQRAAQALQTVESSLRAVPVPPPPAPRTQTFDIEDPPIEEPPVRFTPGDGSGSRQPVPQGAPHFAVGGPVPNESTYTLEPVPDYDPGDNGNDTTIGDEGDHSNGDVIDLTPIPDGPLPHGDPTPDGPIDGGVSTLPGPGTGAHAGVGSGGSGSGLGSGLGMGLAAGVGGGAALARVARLAGGGLGGSGVGGAGATKLLGGAGAATRGGGLPGGLLGKAGGAVGGAPGIAGGGIGGAAGGTAGGGAAGGTGGRGAGMMGGGAGGAGGARGRGDDKKSQGRGLGGPIAPRLEDDEDFGPRSESAGSGGRE